MNQNQEIAVYDNTVSARTYLSYIAEQAGGFACIGRDGKLYIKKIGENLAEIPIKNFANFTWGDSFKVSKIKYEDGIQVFEKGSDTNNTIYISQDNMYIVKQEQIDNIHEAYQNLTVYSFEGESIIDPSLDVGDILTIDSKQVIYQGSSEYKGKFKASIASKIQNKAKEETTTRTPSQKTINRRVQSQIDQENAKITQLVEETSEHDSKLTQVEQDLDSIKQKVQNSVEYKRSIEGSNQIVLEDCQEEDLCKFKLCGIKEYNNYLYPSSNLYPSNSLYPNQEVVS